MDGRTERQRIESDPTMDNHIVHAVSVSNKKEQSHLRNKERNLENEFKVEQHIIRREEKSLLKQFHKLQLEKYHRHQELHSPRGSERRLLSAYGGVHRSTHAMNRPGSSSGHGLHHTQHDHTDHGSTHSGQPMTSHSGMRLSRQYPSSSMISSKGSNYAPSHVSSNQSAHRGAGRDFPSNYAPSHVSSNQSAHKGAGRDFPLIDSHSRSRHHIAGHDHRHRHDVTTDDEDAHHQHHLHQPHPPPHPQHSHHHAHARDEIEDLVDSYMLPHQPAGYGHSIKEEHRDAHYHRLHRDKHKHRRHTVDFDYPGNFRNIGYLHRLNDIGPDSYSHPRLLRLKQASVSGSSSLGRLVPRTARIEHETQLLRSEPERAVNGRAHEQSHDSLSSQGKRRSTSHTSIPHPKPHATSEPGTDTGQNLKITIQINRKKGDKSEPGDVAKMKGTRSSEEKTRDGRVRSGTSLAGSSKSIEKEAHRGHVNHPGASGRISDHPPKAPSQEEMEAEMMAELKAMCGNATQGYFTGHGGGFGNRRTRFKQLVKELLMKQMPAMARKRHLAEFDPLEALQCRYLRLSPRNIEDLVEMCKKSGVEVDLHPHSEITDVTKHVFPHENKEEAHSG